MSLSDTRFSPWSAWKVFSQQPTILLEAVESGTWFGLCEPSRYLPALVNIYNLHQVDRLQPLTGASLWHTTEMLQ